MDVVILLRADGNSDLVNWVNAGGRLITEWTSFDWAVNNNLLDASLGGGNFVGTQTITFTALGLAMGLDNGLGNSYSDPARTDFLRLFTTGSSDILATWSGGAAIIGDTAGSGYVVGNAYDWADWSEGSPAGLPNTQQLLLNMIGSGSVSTPDAGSTLTLLGVALSGVFMITRRSCER